MLRTYSALGLVAVGSLLAAGFTACSGDDTQPNDAGSDTTSQPDTFVPPSDAPSDSPPVDSSLPPNAKAIVVHASPDVPAVRICFAVGLTEATAVPANFAALPDDDTESTAHGYPYPGIFPGTGGVLPDFGLDLSKLVLVPYVMIASKITTDVKSNVSARKCPALLATDGGLTNGLDYLKEAAIPAGTFKPSTTVLLAATGCLPTAADPGANAATCGSNYNPTTGNIEIKIFNLDRTSTIPSAKLGAQLAHLSSPTQGKLQGGAPLGITGMLMDIDAQVPSIVASGVPFATVAPDAAAQADLGTVSNTVFVTSVANVDGGTPVATIPLPLPTIFKLSTGLTTGADTYFEKGKMTTFVVLGDPTQPQFLPDSSTFNGLTFHVLAFPNDPPVVPAN